MNKIPEGVLGVSEMTEFPEYDRRNKELCYRIRHFNDPDAKKELCERNAGFIYNVAKYHHNVFGNLLEMNDLMQEGYIGLLEAADRMDYEQETTFTTYAYYYLIKNMRRAVENNGYMIRIPVHVHEKIRKLVKLDVKYEQLPLEERREKERLELGVSEKRFKELLYVLDTMLGMLSTDNILEEDETLPFGGVVLIASRHNPEKFTTRSCCKDDLFKAMDLVGLTRRQKDVLFRRFGAYDGYEMTLEEVGKAYNITRERVRQIEARALRLLRRPSARDLLIDYVGEPLGDDENNIF